MSRAENLASLLNASGLLNSADIGTGAITAADQSASGDISTLFDLIILDN